MCALLVSLQFDIRAGGRYYVIDMRRQQSVFEMQPELKQTVAEGIAKDGSNLGVITSAFLWEDPKAE